MEDKQPEVE